MLDAEVREKVAFRDFVFHETIKEGGASFEAVASWERRSDVSFYPRADIINLLIEEKDYHRMTVDYDQQKIVYIAPISREDRGE